MIEPNSMKRNAMLIPCRVALRKTPTKQSPSPTIEPFSIVPPWVDRHP
jgi:hypothetical protein